MSNESPPFRDVVDVGEARRRPGGVTLIAILLFLYAAFLVGILTFAITRPEVLRSSNSRRNSEIAWELAYVTPIRIGMAIVLGAGILRLIRWARKGLIFFAGVTVLGRTSVLIRPSPIKGQLTYAQEVEILACVLLIGYLVSSQVSNAFELGPQSDE
jgi:hypothetical protein